MGHCAVPDIQLFNLFCSKLLLVTVNDPNCHKIASDPIFTLTQGKNTASQNMTFFTEFGIRKLFQNQMNTLVIWISSA